MLPKIIERLKSERRRMGKTLTSLHRNISERSNTITGQVDESRQGVTMTSSLKSYLLFREVLDRGRFERFV